MARSKCCLPIDDPDLCAGGEERLCRVEALHEADSEAEHPHASRVPPPVLRPNRRDVRVLKGVRESFL